MITLKRTLLSEFYNVLVASSRIDPFIHSYDSWAYLTFLFSSKDHKTHNVFSIYPLKLRLVYKQAMGLLSGTLGV